MKHDGVKALNRIRPILERKGVKITWLAKELGKSYPTVYGYVSNSRQPSLECLYDIARILDVDVKDLIVSSK